MIYTDLTKKAMKLAYQKHHGQYDKGGVPYIFHPFHVAEQMNDEVSTVVALLHDILEDTDTTIEELKEIGCSDAIIEMICTLTKPREMSYYDYIKEIKKNAITRKVKLADLRHNQDKARLSEITNYDLERLERYQKSIEILNG